MRGAELVTHEEKACVPQSIRSDLVTWHHENLQYRGRDRRIKTIVVNFKCPERMKEIDSHTKNCDVCQKHEIVERKKHGKIP